MTAELTTVLPAGAAVHYGASENRVRLAALAQPAMPGAAAAVMPFIGRGIRREVMAGEDVGSLRQLQPALPDREDGGLIAPFVEWRAGTVLAVPGGEDGVFELYVIDRDVVHPFGAEPDLSTPLPVRRYDVRSGAIGELIPLPRGQNQSVLVLAGTIELQFAAPPDRFLAILETPLLREWTVQAATAVAEFPNDRIDAAADVTLSDNGVTLHLAYDLFKWPADPTPFNFADVHARLHDGSVTPHSGNWKAEHVVVHGDHHGERIYLTAKAYQFRLTYGTGPIAATRETFHGSTFKGFSHRIFGRDPQISALLFARNAFVVNVFGRDARIYQPAEDFVAVVHEGEPLADDERSALTSLLAYLAGNRLAHISTETFGADSRLSYEYHARGQRTERGLPPLRIDHWTETPVAIAEQLGALLHAMLELYRAKPMKLDAALHHYFEGVNSNYPVSRTLQLAVAIDALVALHIGNKEMPIIDRDVFKKLIKPVRQVLDLALRAFAVPDDPARQLRNKLDNLNKASARRRQNSFWKSVGISLTPAELEILDTRHEVVHEGHLGEERGREALMENYRRSNVLANLFNRAFLTILGWRGAYRDANDPRSELPLTTGNDAGESTEGS